MQITPHIQNFLALQKITSTTMLEMQEETPQIIAEEPAFSSIECLNTLYKTLRSLISRYLWKPENQRGAAVSEGTETFYQKKVEPHLKSCTPTQLQQIAKTLRALSARWQHAPSGIAERLLAKAKQISKMDEEESKPTRTPKKQPPPKKEVDPLVKIAAALPGWDAKTERMKIGGVDYQVLTNETRDFSAPLICCGVGAQPTIVAMNSSKTAEFWYDRLKEALKNKGLSGQKEIVRFVAIEVKEKLFGSNKPSPLQHTEFLGRQDKQQFILPMSSPDSKMPIPVVSFEALASNFASHPWHGALLLCYFLDRLIEDGILHGQVQYRYKIEGPHLPHKYTWALFIPAEKENDQPVAWCIDCLTDLVGNICVDMTREHPGTSAEIGRLYSKETLAAEKRNLASLLAKQNQVSDREEKKRT